MSLLDFTEIPPHTETERGAWPLEAFALRFLEALGYRRVSGPTHGADGGQDGIVEIDSADDAGQIETQRWMVSCKHNAHANEGKGTSVGGSDDLNIVDRVSQHGCRGFIGFYSTELTAPFENRLRGISDGGLISVQWFTPSKIEKVVQEKYNELRPLILEFFPESIARHERDRYPSLPAGSEDLQFKRDNPNIDIRTYLTEGTVVTEVGLVEGSAEANEPAGMLTLHSDELPEFMARVCAGESVPVHRSRLSFFDHTTIGRYLSFRSSDDTVFLVGASAQVIRIRAIIRFKRCGVVNAGGAVLRDREIELVRMPDGRALLRTPLPHRSDQFYIEGDLPENEVEDKQLTVNLAIAGTSPSVALEIERALRLIQHPSSVVIFDTQKRKKVVEWDLQPEGDYEPNPIAEVILTKLVTIENLLGVDLVIPECSITGEDCDMIDRVERLITTGTSEFVPKEAEIIIQEPGARGLKTLTDPGPTDLLLPVREAVRFELMGQSVHIPNVVWALSRCRTSIVEGSGNADGDSVVLRLTPTEESQLVAVALDFGGGSAFGEELEHLRAKRIRVRKSVRDGGGQFADGLSSEGA